MFFEASSKIFITASKKVIMTEAAIISVQNDQELIKQFLQNHQAGDGERLAKERLANHFLFEALEYSELPVFTPFVYQNKEVDGQKKYTANDENWDITELTSPDFRRGTQNRAMKNLKEMALDAEVGTSFFRVSLMQQAGESDKDCNYKKTQFDIFTVLEGGDLQLLQLQTRNVKNIEKAEAVLRWWSDQIELDQKPELDELLVTVGKRSSKINLDELLASIDEKPVPNLEELIAQVQQNASLAAEKYFNVLQNSNSVYDISSAHNYFLKQIIFTNTGGLLISVGVGLLDSNCSGKLSKSSETKKRCPRCGVIVLCGDRSKCLLCLHEFQN